MGVASPFQSVKPLEYWLDGLKTTELVQLWEFLSWNQLRHETMSDFHNHESKNHPTPEEVRNHLYSESMPSSFYACKDRGDLRSTAERRKAAQWDFGLYKHRTARDPLNK